MKTLTLVALIFSYSSFAGHSKPELVARYAGIDAFNAPVGSICYTSEPHATADGIYLGCMDPQGFMMVKWNHTTGFNILARSTEYFSHPKEVEGRLSWYEFNEAGVQKVFEYKNSTLTEIKPKNLGPVYSQTDSFVAVKGGNYIYRLQDEAAKSLKIWKTDHTTSTLDLGENAFIFSPYTNLAGEMVAKMRKESLSESASDELILWDGVNLKTILKDKDADPASPIKSFRHQYAYDQGAVALVVTDAQGEAMVVIKNGVHTVVGRVGVHFSKLEFFAPKMRNGVLVFRGEDLQKRKALYLFENNQLKTLLTQGDVVQTDKGPARIHYQEQDAILYGAPGIGPKGEIYQQSTLTDIDSPMTLLGIGLIRFNKE